MNPAAQTITIAAASPRSAQAIRSGSRGNDAQSTSASQYASALSNSIIARAGASDQNADSERPGHEEAERGGHDH